MNHRPVVAVGASSGGRYAGRLLAREIVDASVVMVSALGKESVAELRNRSPDGSTHPPPSLYLALMPRDKSTTRAARKDSAGLGWTFVGSPPPPPEERTEEEIGGGERPAAVFDDTTCVPVPVDVAFLVGRVPGMKPSVASAIVAALTVSDHRDNGTGLLLVDPTTSDWRYQVRAVCGSCLEGHSLKRGRSPLAKALHRAWAFHEYCSEALQKALPWIEARLRLVPSQS